MNNLIKVLVPVFCVILVAVIVFCFFFGEKKDSLIDSNNSADEITTQSFNENVEFSQLKDETKTHEFIEMEPIEDKSENILEDMSQDDIKKLNLFLSNFSEIFIDDFDLSDEDTMLNFGILNIMINKQEQVHYLDGYIEIPNERIGENVMCDSYIYADDVQYRINWYFGKQVANKSTNSFVYKDEKYYIIAAGGESYGGYTKVNEAFDNGDGTITVKYTEFFFDDYFPDPIVYNGIGSENVYNSEVRNTGTAVLLKYDHGGDYSPYRMISLKADK